MAEETMKEDVIHFFEMDIVVESDFADEGGEPRIGRTVTDADGEQRGLRVLDAEPWSAPSGSFTAEERGGPAARRKMSRSTSRSRTKLGGNITVDEPGIVARRGPPRCKT